MPNHRRSLSLPEHELPKPETLKPVISSSSHAEELFVEPGTPEYTDNSTSMDNSFGDDGSISNLSFPDSEGDSPSRADPQHCINITEKLKRDRLALFGIFSPIVRTSGGEVFTIRAQQQSDAFNNKTPLFPAPQPKRFQSKDDLCITPKKPPIKESIVNDITKSPWDVFYDRNKMFSMNIVQVNKRKQDKENNDQAANTTSTATFK